MALLYWHYNGIIVLAFESSHKREGGAHLRISVWHLLMNLENNYLLKKLLKWVKKNV